MTRRSLALVPIGLLLLAFAEIALFVVVANAIGAGWALLALLAASVAGLALLRREGIKGWRAFRAAAESGQPPGRQVSNSLVGLLGALLLAVPGFITAAAGLLLLIPPLRGLAVRGARRLAERQISTAVAGDLFGPRRVRVRRGDPVTEPASPRPAPAEPVTARPASTASTASADVVEGEVVEGEIVR
ncbi:FxsA family protein [Actinoplanes sp. NPDC051633]|uniref:FxsA family protein n=1 Tax=Actinoplanes sp. NPDC051633 TaxID=3155670 RepID=UPI0034284EE7